MNRLNRFKHRLLVALGLFLMVFGNAANANPFELIGKQLAYFIGYHKAPGDYDGPDYVYYEKVIHHYHESGVRDGCRTKHRIHHAKRRPLKHNCYK